MEKERRLKKLDDEIWKPLPFADKHYEISSYGRIKSYCSDPKGSILKPAKIGNFLVVSLRVQGKVKRFCVHKLTAEVFIPKLNQGQTVVIHTDWNFNNNSFTNLKWVTRQEAYSRMHKRNNSIQKAKGIISNSSKLKPADIVHLKTMLQKGITQRTIAKLFCISEMQVTRIKRGENWGNIELPEGRIISGLF